MNSKTIVRLHFATKLLILTLLGVIFFSQSSFAQSGPPKFSAGAMVLFGQGQMGNGSDVPDRAMIHTPIALFGGFNMKRFRLGLNYEYNMIGQSADPATISGNQNLTGKSTALGVRLEYYDGKQAAGIVYRLSDAYALDKPTSAGTSSMYKGSGGISVQYYRQIRSRFGFVVDYTTEVFKESVPAPSGAIKWSRIAVGLVFTNFSGGK